METALDRVVKEAMELSSEDKLVLAGILMESADSQIDPDAESAWNTEILERIRAIDEGREKGIPYEEVMREAKKRFAP
jgi:putative addiction module component (TIGR02574 family)